LVKQKIKQYYQQHKQHRQEFLLQQANLQEDLGNAHLSKIIWRIHCAEQRNEAFKTLQAIRGSNIRSRSISTLKVPASWPTSQNYSEDITDLEEPRQATQWKEISYPKEIEFLLLIRIQRHFGQASQDNTPFTIPPLDTTLNWSATTGKAEFILQGDYSNAEIDTISQLLLDNCTRVTELDSLPKTITEQDMRQEYTRWKESTTTSPSGRHLGHWKPFSDLLQIH